MVAFPLILYKIPDQCTVFERFILMIIDAHTHIYPDDVAYKALNTVMENGNGLVNIHTDGTHSGLPVSMNRAGIDYSIVLPVATGSYLKNRVTT